MATWRRVMVAAHRIGHRGQRRRRRIDTKRCNKAHKRYTRGGTRECDDLKQNQTPIAETGDVSGHAASICPHEMAHQSPQRWRGEVRVLSPLLTRSRAVANCVAIQDSTLFFFSQCFPLDCLVPRTAFAFHSTAAYCDTTFHKRPNRAGRREAQRRGEV